MPDSSDRARDDDPEVERTYEGPGGTAPIPPLEAPRAPARQSTMVIAIGAAPSTAELPPIIQRGLELPFRPASAATSTPPSGQTISLEQLAWLRVALAVAPDDRASLLAVVGLELDDLADEERRWAARLANDPELLARFEALIRETWSKT